MFDRQHLVSHSNRHIERLVFDHVTTDATITVVFTCKVIFITVIVGTKLSLPSLHFLSPCTILLYWETYTQHNKIKGKSSTQTDHHHQHQRYHQTITRLFSFSSNPSLFACICMNRGYRAHMSDHHHLDKCYLWFLCCLQRA